MSESQGSSSQASTHGGDRTPYDDDETSREEELQGGSRPAGSKPPPRILLPRIQRYSGRRSEQIFISIRDAIAREFTLLEPSWPASMLLGMCGLGGCL